MIIVHAPIRTNVRSFKDCQDRAASHEASVAVALAQAVPELRLPAAFADLTLPSFFGTEPDGRSFETSYPSLKLWVARCVQRLLHMAETGELRPDFPHPVHAYWIKDADRLHIKAPS